MSSPENVPMEKLSSPMDSLGDSTPKSYIICMHLLGASDHKLGRKKLQQIIHSEQCNISCAFHQTYLHKHVHMITTSRGLHEGQTSCLCALAHHHTITSNKPFIKISPIHEIYTHQVCGKLIHTHITKLHSLVHQLLPKRMRCSLTHNSRYVQSHKVHTHI